MDIQPVDTSSFTPAQQAAFNSANALGTGVPTVPKPPVTPPTPITAQTTPTPPPPPTTTQPANQAQAGQPGYDVFGKSTGTGGNDTQQARINGGIRTGMDGKQYYNYDNSPVGGPSAAQSTGTQNGTTNTDQNSPTLSDQADRQALAQSQADFQAQAKQVSDTIANINNGTTPLNAGEQAQVSGIQQQYEQLIQQQQLQNTGATGLANVRGYQTGAAEYDPSFQTKTIGSIVSAGQQLVANLQTKEAMAVSQLTQSLRANDIKAVQDAWSAYQDAAKNRQDALQKTINDTQTAIANAAAAAKDVRDYNLNVAKFQQTVSDSAFTQNLETQKFTQQQKQDAFDQAYKMEDLKLKQRANAIASQSLQVPSVGVTASGNANAQAQKAFLATLPPATATAVQQLTSYQMNPADFSNRSVGGGPSQKQQMLTLAHQFDPTFDENKYAARAAFLKSMTGATSNSLGGSLMAANKSINHLDAYVNSVESLNNVPVSFVNAPINFVEGIFGQNTQRNMAQANTEAAGLKDELAKFFKGSGTTDVKSIETWGTQLSPNATPEQLKGTVQGAITLLSGQMDTINQQYTNTMGHPPTTPLLNQEAIQKLSDLKNEGYDVNIPGVYYTDKDAYLKNGGSSEALMAAHDYLLKNNIDGSPENALQWAQISKQ